MNHLICYCRLVCNCGCGLRKDDDIDDSGEARRTIYILLLGAPETGKSTLMRQMRIINHGGMSVSDLRSYKSHILQNLKTCSGHLINAVREAKLEWDSCESEKAANLLSELTSEQWGLEEPDSTRCQLHPTHAHLLSLLWQDAAAQLCWRRANQFNLPDSTEYFLSSALRFASQPFTPTQEDVLRLRLPTHSETVCDFHDRGWIMRVTDVGGQKGTRHRWLRLFDGLDAIIFLAALSEYDQMVSPEEEEEEDTNRLSYSLRIFEQTISYRGFSNTSIILFLNKTDIFEQKIRTSPLSKYFPEYSGPDGDAERAADFIESCFHKVAESYGRKIYVHRTCATDTKSTKFAVAAVREDILWRVADDIFQPL